MVKLNTLSLNSLNLNSAVISGTGEVQRGTASGGGGIVPLPPSIPEEPEPTPTYTLSASVSNGVVSATLNGSAISLPYEANEGDVIVVSVEPNEGFSFDGWADGNTDNPRTITMNADVVLSAECVAIPSESKYIQFADAEVERVLMANGVSSDGVGITMEDAAKVTSISTWFKGNTAITSFDELQYFTGLTPYLKTPTTWNDGAFYNCTSLERVTLPPNVTILSSDFRSCKNLREVRGLEQITDITSEAFNSCSALAMELNLENLKNIVNASFTNSGIVAILSLGNVKNIPGSSTWNYTPFANCTSLKTVVLPPTLESIGDNAFNYCPKMEWMKVLATTPPSMATTNTLLSTNNCPIYVPDASLEAYKTAVNWSAYADRIHPLSEIEDYYVSDALLMHLDGINKGNVEGEWQDLVSGETFVNHGAIAEADGWRFDGASSYMDSATLTNYGPSSKNRTFEVVVEFERENITEVVYMGRSSGYAFGRYEGGKCIIISAVAGFPSFADDMTSGVRIFSASLSDTQLVASEINGNDGQVRGRETFSGSGSFIYLGKRASGNHFKGKIHAIRIHDRVLTEEELLYNQRIDNKRFNLGLEF